MTCRVRDREMPPHLASRGLFPACRCSPRIPRASWTPADPRGSHHSDPSGSASGGIHPLAGCILPAHGAVSSVGTCGLPCGRRGALGPLQRCRSAARCLLHRCHTREEWLVRPSPQGRAPCQKRQAAFGALTHEAQRRAGEQARIFDSSDDLQAARCPARPLQRVIRPRPVRSGDISNR
jgi:hypothetical protein